MGVPGSFGSSQSPSIKNGHGTKAVSGMGIRMAENNLDATICLSYGSNA